MSSLLRGWRSRRSFVPLMLSSFALLIAPLQSKAIESNTPNGSTRKTFSHSSAERRKLESIYRNMNKLHPLIQEEDLPVDLPDHKWQSVNQKVEFLPADGINPSVIRRFLEDESISNGGMTGMENIYNNELFALGDAEYDEYQQAWRLMGFIVDCNPMDDDDYYNQNGGSNDGTADGCARYVLWAAYVDLDYQGGGIGEYQFYDAETKKWDDSACKYTGSERCAKMDCHLESTHFSLLGFFKHKSYDDWMEQLFKHEGMCVWTDEEYAFMKNARESWPEGCIKSGKYTADGEYIYYDIKPIQGGDIEMGLYTDTQCITEYQSTGKQDPITVENILGNFLLQKGDYYDFYDDTLEDSMARWTSAFNKFRLCQPCVAYDMENIDGTKYMGDDYYGGDGNNNNNEGGNMFDCYDDADYTNVNQCMKFMAKTAINTATFRDMSLGRYQGTLTATQMNGLSGVRSWRAESFSNSLTYLFLAAATVYFLYGYVYLHKSMVNNNYKPMFNFFSVGNKFKEPLVDEDEA